MSVCQSVGAGLGVMAGEQVMENKPNDATAAICSAALRVFAQYGFRRTSMEDIARGAGMSRPALYLHFRNKEDIFRRLAQMFFAEATGKLAAALTMPGQADEVLLRAFAAKDGDLVELILQSPHGDELLDTGFSISADIVTEGETGMAALLAEWFTAQGIPDGLGSGDDVAKLAMSALKGLKTTSGSFAEYRDGRARLALMLARALRQD